MRGGQAGAFFAAHPEGPKFKGRSAALRIAAFWNERTSSMVPYAWGRVIVKFSSSAKPVPVHGRVDTCGSFGAARLWGAGRGVPCFNIGMHVRSPKKAVHAGTSDGEFGTRKLAAVLFDVATSHIANKIFNNGGQAGVLRNLSFKSCLVCSRRYAARADQPCAQVV